MGSARRRQRPDIDTPGLEACQLGGRDLGDELPLDLLDGGARSITSSVEPRSVRDDEVEFPAFTEAVRER
jgi:hypothetical protein